MRPQSGPLKMGVSLTIPVQLLSIWAGSIPAVKVSRIIMGVGRRPKLTRQKTQAG